MKELTLEQKINFCELYSGSNELHVENHFICNRFKDYYHTGYLINLSNNDLTEEEFITVFPELHEIITKIGKDLYENYRWTHPWIIEHTEFRKAKIGGLLKTLKS